MEKDDLISRSRLQRMLDALPFNQMDFPEFMRAEQIVRIVRHQPAIDAVEVVRCRDCVRRKTLRNGSHVCPYSTVDLELDDFCHRGKRKDDVNGCK